ncbi:NAD(P)-binding protein [Acidiferrimicrobium sp. IK]|uniref:NAD(P)-binding protein n=1 Tax=Acidiferrimicrobium sp. IK TaxID=2871700 RepID=UPI0021CB5DFA|nr:NAD(P)-binding protein [Acidiferrimicrobium sp. IK]MCU4184054.1 NAD(P)-binding protein [Acidiferrimicrobium sp. IK]
MTKPFAITLEVGSSLRNRTGNWRTERPVYVERLPPCNAGCPSGEDIQGWLYRAEEGDYEAAWRILVEANPLPAIMGRVCFRPCETACNRGQLDEAVGINAVERHLGDEALRRGWRLPEAGADTGRRVLVVGAGPCGLSAAYQLRRLGHAVTVVDAEPHPGGMMRTGIPAYRLPRQVLAAEVERIMELGVDLQLGTRVGDVDAALRDGGYDAALVAVGAQLSRRAEIPAGDTARIISALSLLRSVEEGGPLEVGRKVAVYGGGDTAFDAARTARRLGATDAVVVYRRTRDRAPAHDVEMEEAEAEGVQIRWLSTVRRADGGRLVLERMRLDDRGTPQPTGELDELDADCLVLAVGQDTDLSLLDAADGVTVSGGGVDVAADLMTGHPGIFAGGDAVAGERSVATAVGHGARAARRIDRWLAGEVWQPPAPREPATFDRINAWYYSDAPHAVRPLLDAARRRSTFDEVVGGLDESTALYEARRCLSCGNCLECDNCYGVCPDNAVVKLGPGERYAINYDYCKGCGLCVAECPCGAMAMIPETT